MRTVAAETTIRRMERLFGLPAHPLIVHFPVVAIPALAIAALIWVVKPWSKNASLGLAAFGIVTTVSTILAASSGEALADLLQSGESIDRHRELGNTLRLIVIVQTVGLLGMVGVELRQASEKNTVGLIFRAVTAVLSILSVIWVIRVGHEGASQSWGFLS